MRSMALAGRNFKELRRDPLMAIFSIGFPVVLLFLLSAIQANIPVELFEIKRLAPGVAAFGLSFISLFAGMLISRDRKTSFLARLMASPLTAKEYLFSYIAPLFPVAVIQIVLCFALALILGMPVSWNLLLGIIVLIPTAILFIGLGLLIGIYINDKAVGGIASILVNVAAWLSGTWFDIGLIGGVFADICNALPFVHGVEAARAAVVGNYGEIMPHLWWVIGYAAVILILSALCFRWRMQKGKLA